LTVIVNVTPTPGGARTSAGSVMARVVVVTLAATIPPDNDVVLVPLIMADPWVVVDVTVPGKLELSLAPPGTVVVAVLTTQHAVLLDMRFTMIGLAVVVGFPKASSTWATTLPVALPLALIVVGVTLSTISYGGGVATLTVRGTLPELPA
jgi:hypothetical protein